VAAPFTSATSNDGISPHLAALIAASAAAEKAYKNYSDNVCEPLFATAKAQIAALPHTTATIHDRLYSTAVHQDVRLSGAIVAGGRGRPFAREDYREHRAFTAAAMRRQRNADRIRKHVGIGAANDEADRLSEAWADSQGAVAAHPISTAADLNAKLTFMVESEMDGESGWLSHIAADAARLVKMEG
jgi:hypothetical protein